MQVAPLYYQDTLANRTPTQLYSILSKKKNKESRLLFLLSELFAIMHIKKEEDEKSRKVELSSLCKWKQHKGLKMVLKMSQKSGKIVNRNFEICEIGVCQNAETNVTIFSDL